MTLDPDLALYTVGVFLLLLVVLRKFAWKPIIEALDKREHAIAKNIDDAQQLNEQAKGLLSEYERRLAGAQDQVRALLDEARHNAEHAAAEVASKAKADAAAELARAKREIGVATDAALKTLAEHHANQAIALAGKILGKELNAKEHDRTIADAVAKFPSLDPSQN